MIKVVDSQLEQFFKDLGSFAASDGKQIMLVGGCVRDEILGFSTKDFDLIIEGDAIEFANSYAKSNKDFEILEAFDPFKTIKVKFKNTDFDIEFASARKEIYKESGGFPKLTELTTIKEDLPRRDFTINALLKSIMPDNYGEIIDYAGGQEDIKSKLIRVFHDQSFIDDPTRIYRAARFTTKYDFEIEPHTYKLMEEASKHPDKERWMKKRKNRFQIELDYINNLENPSKALQLLSSLELLI